MTPPNKHWMRLLLAALLVLALSLTATAVLAQEGGHGGETAPAAETQGETAAEAAPAEAAPSTNPLVPLGINTGFLLAQIINFGIIFVLLSVFLWPRLTKMLDNRAATIQKGLEDAAAAAAARKNAEADAEKVLADARAQAAKIIEEARARGEEVAKAVENEARAAAEKIRADELVKVEAERNKQLADLRGQVAAIAIAMSQKLIGETLDEQRQQALIKDFFAKVPAEAKSLSGAIEVVSAMPLTDDEIENVKAQTGASEVTNIVDPNILGGLIIRSTDRVVDGSVRSSLNDLAARLR
ncbi:MAG: F0F1 ATP synthase subunit B [Anaerolinea sp.]|nr:F0F1 ATP synthase subunit B [Anaerolinea sp.]